MSDDLPRWVRCWDILELTVGVTVLLSMSLLCIYAIVAMIHYVATTYFEFYDLSIWATFGLVILESVVIGAILALKARADAHRNGSL